MRFLRPVSLIVLVLAFDQCLKFWIKLDFTYNESKRIFSWFYLYFIENEGMAFGMTWGGEAGKLMLSLFRLLAVVLIGIYLVNIINKKAHPGFITSMSLIFAGALGNIIDSVFYGTIFSASTASSPAVLFPSEGGYAALLHGRVVDMLYFPLFEGFLPKWLPVYGGDYFIFFRPIFNIADASITCGVLMIILFQKRFFRKEEVSAADAAPEVSAENSDQASTNEQTS
ncbi:MAG: lipoprotein signal peptidase, partial [Chitinophagales bacterium]